VISLGERTIPERLASIETSLEILIKINNKDHKKNNEDHTLILKQAEGLKDKVNDELSLIRKRINKIEKNSIRTETEVSIYKKIAIFLLGAVALGASSYFFSVVLPKLTGA